MKCVVGTTKILTEAGEYDIEFLYNIAKKRTDSEPSIRLIGREQKVHPDGDPYAYELPMKVYAYANGKLVQSSAFVWKIGTSETIRIKTRFTEIEGGADHEILTKNGWKKLREISITERIPVYRGGSIILDEVIEVTKTGKNTVYAITVPKYYNYITNGIVSHNRDICLL